MAVKRADLLQNSKREIARAATQIEQGATWPEMRGCCFRHQFEDQPCVNGGLLAVFELAEPFNIMVKAAADFLDRGFFHKRNTFCVCLSFRLHEANLAHNHYCPNCYNYIISMLNGYESGDDL